MSEASPSTARNAFDVLSERGFVKQVTDAEAVRAMFAAGPVTVYIGYDPTADSLHAGNLFTLMALTHLERLGHRPLVVLGAGTARVGDPTGKTELRQMLADETIAKNRDRIRQQIGRLLDLEGGKTRIVDNSQWLLELKYVEFLREVGRHFSVNRMLAAEAYKQRLERGLSFIELNYQILQAYDYVELRRRYDCRLQMGGDDQWGNIVAGVDLCRRIDGELVHGLTVPLLVLATGEKMGKTVTGAVWLDPEQTDPFVYYQFWVNTHDDDVVAMLGYYTCLPMEEIRAVASLAGEERNFAKSVLAYEATRILHGDDAAGEAHRGALAGFGKREIPASILPSSRLSRRVDADRSALPTTELGRAELEEGVTVIELMVRCGLAASKGAARRLVDQGAVKLNDARVSEQLCQVTSDDVGAARAFTLRAGKKKVHRFVLRD